VFSERRSRQRSAGGTLLKLLLRPDLPWQMKYGERCALEGILTLLKPALAIEIGTAQGGSLQRLAAHAEEVHSFDLVNDVADLAQRFENVEFHVGDSASLLPEVLAELAANGRNVDFVLVDGDHTTEGVQRDARALLESDACRDTVIVFHDAANDEVREGLDALALEQHPKVALAMLDFVPGYLVKDGPRRFEIWNGLALAVLDASRGGNGAIVDAESFDAAALNRRMRDALRAEEHGETSSAASGEPELRESFDDIPERFVPDQMGEGLVAAEHLGRYWFASRFASGRRVLDAGCGTGYGSTILAEAGARSVLGVDIAEPVLEAVRPDAHPAVTFEVGDVTRLELPDAVFDLVVCFELIEHVENPNRVLDELARVLAPDGLLIVSSPNRAAYVPGNPHHVHEFLPDELREALESRFESVRLLRQHDWVASAIFEDEAFEACDGKDVPDLEVRKLVGHRPGREVYTVALAGNVPVPRAPTPVALTHTLELRQWMENYHAQQRVLSEQADYLRELQTLNRERRDLRAQLERLEAELARAPERDLCIDEQERRINEQNRRIGDLETHLNAARDALRDVTDSPSWRMTAPLRRAKSVVRRTFSS